MRTELLQAVARLITVHCWWVRPVATCEYHRYCTIRDGHLRVLSGRCLTLEVKRSRGHHYVGHRWHICESLLDRAVNAMRRESPDFRSRCKRLDLTPEDVQNIIKRASYGIIDLDMVDDDYRPKIE